MGFNDEDYGCTCPHSDKWYACPIESKKPENIQALQEYSNWLPQYEGKWMAESEEINMTREEAIAILKNEKECVNRANKNDYCNRDCYNCELVKTDTEILTALNMAINSLEVDEQYQLEYEEIKPISALSENNVLDKIRAEIDEKISHYEHFSSSNTANGLMIAKKIIDKYKAESEN